MILPHTHIVSLCAKSHGQFINYVLKLDMPQNANDIKQQATAQAKQILAAMPGRPQLNFIASIIEIQKNGTLKNIM